MLGDDKTWSMVELARALEPPLFIVILTTAFPGTVLSGISIKIWLAFTIEQNADATAFTVALQK